MFVDSEFGKVPMIMKGLIGSWIKGDLEQSFLHFFIRDSLSMKKFFATQGT